MSKKRAATGTGTLFKRQGKGPWIMSFFDHEGRRVTRSTKTTDKAAAQRILAKQVADTALRREGVVDAGQERVAIESRRPIGEHLADWKAALVGKGISGKRVDVVFNRAKRIIDDRGMATLGDVTAEAVRRFAGQLREQGAATRTINGYLQAIGQFIRWTVGERRLAIDPLARIGTMKQIAATFERRPLDPEELLRLLAEAERGPAHQRISGPDRAMLYRLAAGTGFRAAELRSLTTSSFDLDAEPPAVTVRAGYTKNRREARQPIRRDLAERLRPWLAGRPGDAPVFATMPEKLPPMVRADLRRARVVWRREATTWAERRARRAAGFLRWSDGDGRVVDFHALRATYITALVKGGASVKVAQELARHSDPKLTMNTYTKLGIHDLAGALDALPGEADQPATLAATGTDDQRADPPAARSACAARAARNGADRCEPVRDGRENIGLGEVQKTPCFAERNAPVRTGASRSEKATGGIRTHDLSFTKAPL